MLVKLKLKDLDAMDIVLIGIIAYCAYLILKFYGVI